MNLNAKQMPKLISICIPAYERVDYLRRLLDSIVIQTFADVEVIVSDDSKTDQVFQLVQEYSTKLELRYFRNLKSFGTPANWNKAISEASGIWIKLMHDDDWFATSFSLQTFADRTKSGKEFLFSAYANHFEGAEVPIEQKYLTASWSKRILDEPMTLLAYNVIGPPSVIMIKKSIDAKYDEHLKWRVDMEYYVRLLELLHGFDYINEVLVNVGVSDSQVTQSCIYQPTVELPEGKILLQKHGDSRLRNIWVYDAWWRLLRNMNIHTNQQLETYSPGEWPAVIKEMVNDLRHLPASLLKFGILSKIFMFISYMKNKSSVSRRI